MSMEMSTELPPAAAVDIVPIFPKGNQLPMFPYKDHLFVNKKDLGRFFDYTGIQYVYAEELLRTFAATLATSTCVEMIVAVVSTWRPGHGQRWTIVFCHLHDSHLLHGGAAASNAAPMAELVGGRVPVLGRDRVASSCMRNNPPPPHLPYPPSTQHPRRRCRTRAAAAAPVAAAPAPATETFGRQSDSVNDIKSKRVHKALREYVATQLKQAMAIFRGKLGVKDELGFLRVGIEELAKKRRSLPFANFLGSESVKTSQCS